LERLACCHLRRFAADSTMGLMPSCPGNIFLSLGSSSLTWCLARCPLT
jgi:hypothetical protein